MSQKLKFVVRSEETSKIFSDVRAAVDACRVAVGTPCRSSMHKIRLIVDGRVEMKVGTDFIFFNERADLLDRDDLPPWKYAQLFVCEEV